MPHPRWKTKDEFPGSISIPFGIKTSHTWHEIGQILRIINDLDVQTFIEIGAHVGGLGSIISCVTYFRDYPFIYRGVENNIGIVDGYMKDFVSEMDAHSVETAQFLRILAQGKTMWYCDGGDKVVEMMTYGVCCRAGDILSCHDFYDGQEVVGLEGFGRDEGKCGCVPEVFYNDLKFLDRSQWRPLDSYLLEGTRIAGFVKL